MAATLALLTAVGVWSKNTVVVGTDDNEIVARATVISRNGMILGVTDDKGRLPAVAEKDYPIVIRSLGYKEQAVAEPADTVRLAMESYNLPEIAVVGDERPVMRVICYVREYSSAATPSDTIQMYSEYMAESFIPVKEKVKGYKNGDQRIRVLNKRQYARHADAQGDSVFVPGKDEDPYYYLAFAEMISEVPSKYSETSRIKGGATADTVAGKYGPKFIFSKGNDRYIVHKDALADYAGHKYSPSVLKLLGVTMDITQLSRTLAFASNEQEKYTAVDFISGSYNTHVVGRGKWLKKVFKAEASVDLDCYVELCPIDVTFLTVDEYKDLRKEKKELPFPALENIPAALPSAKSIVDRVMEKK